MERTLKWHLIMEVMPDAKWSGMAYGTDSFEWLDERPIPTEEVLLERLAANNARIEIEMEALVRKKEYEQMLYQNYLDSLK